MTGYFIDLTGVRETAAVPEGDATLVKVAEARSILDQAKGIVMVAVGCDDDAAFALLRTWAVDKEMKLSQLAQRLVGEVAARPLADDVASRAALENLLHTLVR